MPNPETIELHFHVCQAKPVLVNTELKTMDGKTAIAVAAENEGPGRFVWNISKGKLRLVALALVRAARLVGPEENDDGRVLLFKAERASSVTRRCTETQLADMLAYKECGWLAAILSPTNNWNEAKRRYSRWFIFHNIRGKDSPVPPTVELNIENLRPRDVKISVNGHPAGPEEVDWIESVLSAHIMPEFPPYLISSRHRTAGYMPSVGPAFGDRDRELAELTNFYRDARCSLVEIVSEGGFGKTALARWWMRQLFRDNILQETVVFSWSFPRQSRNDGTRQSLTTFFRTLGRALGITIEDGLMPQELAGRIVAGMRETPTFLFLDGVEALLDQLGGFSIGGERSENTNASAETTFHYDSLLHLLREIVANVGSRFAFLLVTSRTAIGPIVKVSLPNRCMMNLAAYSSFAYSDEELEREGLYDPDGDDKALGDALSAEKKVGKRQKPEMKDDTAIGRTFAAFQKAEVTQRLRLLVRRSVDKFGISPERCMLYVACCFDQDADWDAVIHVIRSEEGGCALTVPFKHLSDDEWGNVSENLLAANLIQPAGGGYISFHPGVQQCVYDDFRKNMAESCVEVHRRLYAYFFKLPKMDQPDNVEDMQPLFRACWHGCNAGKFRDTFYDVVYERLSRKWEAYILFTLCEYEESLQILNLFTEDGETFPASDLDEDTRTTIIHGCGLALRYVDRLNEAYRVEKCAWKRSMALRSRPQLPAIASNLLRLHHIFGDLGKDASPILWSVLSLALPKIRTTAQEEDIPRSFVPQAIGYMAGIGALIQALRGNTIKANAILLAAWGASRLAGSRNQYLMPEMGSVHHALALLELGRWETVLKAAAAGELDAAVPRYRQTGAVLYLKGRALSDSSSNEQVQVKALALVEECLNKVKGNFKWWTATALHEIGTINLRMKRIDCAKAAYSDALKMSIGRRNQFKLIEVDSRLGLAECELTVNNVNAASEHAKMAFRRIKECGYGSRRRIAERFFEM